MQVGKKSRFTVTFKNNSHDSRDVKIWKDVKISFKDTVQVNSEMQSESMKYFCAISRQLIQARGPTPFLLSDKPQPSFMKGEAG
jgi:hypothetical protein